MINLDYNTGILAAFNFCFVIYNICNISFSSYIILTIILSNLSIYLLNKLNPVEIINEE